MEGRNPNKKKANIPRSELSPDAPLPYIERNNTRSRNNAPAPPPPVREQTQRRVNLPGGSQYRPQSTSQVPPQYLRERRGTDAAHAELLKPYLGPINPAGQQKLLSNSPPARASNPDQISESNLQTGVHNLPSSSQTSNGAPLSRYIAAPSSDRLPRARQHSRQHSSSHQLSDRSTVSRNEPEAHKGLTNLRNPQQQRPFRPTPPYQSFLAQPSTGNFQYTGPINYNPLTEALNPNDTSHYPTPIPQNLRQRVQNQSISSTPRQNSYAQKASSNQVPIEAQRSVIRDMNEPVEESRGLRDTSIGSSITGQGSFGVLVPPGKKRGRPTGSKTKYNNTRRSQPPPARELTSGPAKAPPPLSAVPVPISQQLNTGYAALPRRKATFSLGKNASVMLSPFIKIVPAILKLVADDGQVWEYKYAGTRRNWKKGQNGKVSVAKLNEWANTILRRRLPGHFPAAAAKRSSSAPLKTKADKWTEWEKVFLEAHIMDAVKAKKTNFDEEDWKLVAEAQNEEFAEYKRLPGLPLAQTTSRTLTIDNIPVVRGGGFTKTEGYFPERSSTEIQSMLYHWPEIQEKIKEEIKKNGGKVPVYLDCDTDVSDSEFSSDDENGIQDSITVDVGGNELTAEDGMDRDDV